MKVLVHFKKQHLETLSQRLVLQNEKFINKDFDLDKTLMTLMSEVQEFFRQIGASNPQSTVSQLKTHLDLAVSGINPNTQERVKTHRRDLVRTANYYCMSGLANVIQEQLEDIENVINEASNTLNQVLLSAIQSKLITDHLLNTTDTIEKCTKLWEQLKANEQIALIDKKLKLDILQEDISILMDKAFTKLKS